MPGTQMNQPGMAHSAAPGMSGMAAGASGQQPEGSAVLTAGGWMTGMLAVRDRPNLSTDDLVLASEEERALAFSTYIAYCGTYEIDGDVLITRVENRSAISSCPATSLCSERHRCRYGATWS